MKVELFSSFHFLICEPRPPKNPPQSITHIRPSLRLLRHLSGHHLESGALGCWKKKIGVLKIVPQGDENVKPAGEVKKKLEGKEEDLITTL